MNLRDIVARLRVILDKEQAQRTESEAKGSFDRIKSAAAKLAVAIGAAFAVKRLAEFGRESMRIAAESEAIWSRLGGALRNAGEDFVALEGGIRAAARAMQDITTMGDEDFATALAALVQQTGDYTASMGRMQLVADLAASRQISFAHSAELVGRAMAGNTMQLERMFPALRDSKDILADLSDLMGGEAERHASTLQGRTQQLGNEWGDFREELGKALISMGGGVTVTELLIAAVKALTWWLGEMSPAFEVIGSVVGNVARGIGVLVKAVWGLVEIVSGALLGALAAGARGLAFLADGYAIATTAAAKFLGLFSPELQAGLDAHTESIRQQSAAIKEWARTQEAAAGVMMRRGLGFSPVSAQAAPGATTTTPRTGGAGAQTLEDEINALRRGHDLRVLAKSEMQRALEIERRLKEELAAGNLALARRIELQQQLNTITPVADAARERGVSGRLATRGHGAGVDVKQTAVGKMQEEADWERRRAELWAESWLEANRSIVAGAYSAAYGVASAWHSAFDQILQEGENLGAFMSELGKGIGAAMLGGVSEYAAAKMQTSVAEAISQTALAFGRAAMGDFAGAATHAKSAATHGAAAAAWAALSGGASSASGAVRGGGGGGGTSSTRAGDVGMSAAVRAHPPGAEVNIYIDPLDPFNPAYQRNALAATQYARERYGDNARINVLPRTR